MQVVIVADSKEEHGAALARVAQSGVEDVAPEGCTYDSDPSWKDGSELEDGKEGEELIVFVISPEGNEEVVGEGVSYGIEHQATRIYLIGPWSLDEDSGYKDLILCYPTVSGALTHLRDYLSELAHTAHDKPP